MTDADRDQIDYDVQVFMKNCNELIQNHKSEGMCVKRGERSSSNLRCSPVTLKQKNMKPQAKEHQLLVIALVEQYMKRVCNIYTQQKVRQKRAGMNVCMCLTSHVGCYATRRFECDVRARDRRWLASPNRSDRGLSSALFPT